MKEMCGIEYRSDGGYTVVMYVDKKRAGSCRLIVHAPEGEAMYYGIWNVWIDREYRRNGYARFMLKRAIELAMEHDVPYVWLQVDPDNTAAQRLYSSLGFVPVATDDSIYMQMVLWLNDMPVNEYVVSYKVATHAYRTVKARTRQEARMIAAGHAISIDGLRLDIHRFDMDKWHVDIEGLRPEDKYRMRAVESADNPLKKGMLVICTLGFSEDLLALVRRVNGPWITVTIIDRAESRREHRPHTCLVRAADVRPITINEWMTIKTMDVPYPFQDPYPKGL